MPTRRLSGSRPVEAAVRSAPRRRVGALLCVLQILGLSLTSPFQIQPVSHRSPRITDRVHARFTNVGPCSNSSHSSFGGSTATAGFPFGANRNRAIRASGRLPVLWWSWGARVECGAPRAASDTWCRVRIAGLFSADRRSAFIHHSTPAETRFDQQNRAFSALLARLSQGHILRHLDRVLDALHEGVCLPVEALAEELTQIHRLVAARVCCLFWSRAIAVSTAYRPAARPVTRSRNAWETFDVKNGCSTLDVMRDRIGGIRARIDYRAQHPWNEIGCILLARPTFFTPDAWRSIA